jgi:hypothetical protein
MDLIYEYGTAETSWHNLGGIRNCLPVYLSIYVTFTYKLNENQAILKEER